MSRRDAQPALKNAEQRGLGYFPNKHFATQKVFLYRRKHCLLALRTVELPFSIFTGDFSDIRFHRCRTLVFCSFPILRWTDAILLFEHPAKVKLVIVPNDLSDFTDTVIGILQYLANSWSDYIDQSIQGDMVAGVLNGN